MIDLSTLGLSTVQTPHHGGKRDKAGASDDHGKNQKNFGDLVNEAGKKGAKKHGAHDDDATAKPGHGKLASFDDLKGVELVDGDDGESLNTDLLEAETAATTPESAEPESRVRLPAGFQQLLKAGAEGGVLRPADGTKPEVKIARFDKPESSKLKGADKEPKPTRDDLPAVKEKTSSSPSEELHALLGLAPKKDDTDEDAVEIPDDKPAAKATKHEAADDKVTESKAAKTEQVAAAIDVTVKADANGAQQAVVQQHVAAKMPVADTPAHADADDRKAPAENEVDKVRLVSSDGKSRPVDIELAKTSGHDKADPAAAGKVDFVTVLDSRRYLGFSSDTGNAAVLTNAIKAEPSWAQVIHAVNTGADRTATEVNTLKLQMNPEHLGNMTASLRLKGDELSVEVRVETADAYRQLSKDQDSIVKALKDQGFAIDQVSIQMSPSARADGGQGNASQNNSNQNNGSQNSSSQSGNGQNLQQGGQGDNNRQRDESARRNTNQNNWAGNERTASFSDSGSSSDDAGTGNLYL